VNINYHYMYIFNDKMFALQVPIAKCIVIQMNPGLEVSQLVQSLLAFIHTCVVIAGGIGLRCSIISPNYYTPGRGKIVPRNVNK